MPKAKKDAKPVTELHAIVKRVDQVRTAKGELDDEEDILWDRFSEIADDSAGALETYRYFDPELEKGMARIMHKNTPRIDVAALEKTLTATQWKLVTKQERVFDMALLTKAVASGKVPKGVVEEVTETKPPTPHKTFIDKPTKEDQAAIKRAKRAAAK